MRDFEWLVMPNGTARIDGPLIPEARILQPPPVQHIGALKAACCAQAAGDILVEADHDDELTPDCLEELGRAFDDPSIDFAYSNFAEVRATNRLNAYLGNGWECRTFNSGGREFVEMVAFDPDPASIAKVWYAPNHVRAWRREFYNLLGGHNVGMPVLDDHDLVCRTYIAGKMKRIDRCLYIYHNHEANTCKGDRMAEIQEGTWELHDRYIYRLVDRWCQLNGLRKIDLCGAFNCPAGYESIDIAGDAEILADLNGRWPFDDGEIGVFRAHDALEHLRDPINTMREAYRCLAPKGWMLTQTPSTDGRGAWQDPTHVSFWNSNSFWYYTKADQARFIRTPVRFQCARVKNFFPSEHEKAHNIVYVKADLHKFHGRTPGRVEI